jgi:methyl-accepting chemotaxis protein
MKLQSKFFMFVIIIPIILLGGISFFNFMNQRNIMMEHELQIQEALVLGTANLLSGELNKQKQTLINMSKLESVRFMAKEIVDSIDRDDFLRLGHYAEFVRDLQAFLSEGIVYRVSMGSQTSRAVLADKWLKMPDDFDVRTKNWYKEAVETNDFVLIDPLVSNTDGQVRTQASYPIIEDDKLLGVVGLQINTKSFRDTIREIEKETGYGITVFTSNGTILYHTKIPEEKLATSLLSISDYFTNAVDNPEEILERIANIDSIPFGNVDMDVKGGVANHRFLSYRKIPKTPWVIAISSSKSAIIKSAAAKVIPAVTVLIIIMMTLFISIYFLVNLSIIKHIKRTSFAIKDISEGEGDLTVELNVKTKDEVGELGLNFNIFVSKLRTLIMDVQSSADKSDNIKNELLAASEETSATIGNIKTNTTVLLKETESLNRNVTDNVTVIEEITANISSINNQITEQAAMVEESTASITEMMSSLESMDKITVKKGEAVDKLVAVAGNGAEILSEMADGFKLGVVEKIEGISEMANTIQQISSQTNLLSMNAAIEAAHAGDAGKGFAVVADEIRKLADTSAKSSANITRIIKEISNGVSETEVKTKMSSKAFDTINTEIRETKQAFDEIASSTRELTAGGKQILDAMSILQDVTISVKGASEEMTVGSEQIVRGQLGLKDISEKVTSGMLEISLGSEEIVIASDEIVRYSSELSNVVDDLKEETDKFKT